MQAHLHYFGHPAGNLVDSGSWVSVHRVGTRRIVRRSGWLPGGLVMETVTAREFAPRFVIGLFIAAVAAAGAYALNHFDGQRADRGGSESVASVNG